MLTGLGFNASVLNGWGPLQIMLVIVLTISLSVAGYLFITKRVFPK